MTRFLSALFLAACLGLTTAAPSWAADFSGTWSLDRDASDSPEPLLKAQGVGWMKRKAAAGMDVTQNITHQGDKLTIETVTSARTKTDTLQVDGETRTVEGDKGAAQVRHEWQGEVLVSTSALQTKDGPGTLVVHRKLSDDGQTLEQRIALTLADGSTVEIARVFRKS